MSLDKVGGRQQPTGVAEREREREGNSNKKLEIWGLFTCKFHHFYYYFLLQSFYYRYYFDGVKVKYYGKIRELVIKEQKKKKKHTKRFI